VHRAVWLGSVAGALLGCGGRGPAAAPTTPAATAPRILALSRVIVLETAGPPPSDTSVSFVTGSPRTIVLRHGPPENIVFATLTFPAGAFADSGQTVTVGVKARPGVYGIDLTSSLPLRAAAELTFSYARYFSAPAHARQLYRSDIAYERALAIGRLLPEGQIELLSSSRPVPDHLSAGVTAVGSYLVAGPQ
jgi:hypothetical protein